MQNIDDKYIHGLTRYPHASYDDSESVY